MSPAKKTKPSGAKAARSTRVARDAEPHRVTDARAMRALAHPVRMELLATLTREGPMTATEAAELLGESPANCSFHLRTLAKYGFVEEAEGGTGRSRPWQRSTLGISFDMVADDAGTTLAAREMSLLHMERQFDALRQWNADESTYPDEWRSVAFANSSLAYLTPDELREIEADVSAILSRFAHRTLDKAERPPDALPVSLTATGHPLRPLPSGN